ncbi:MAG TPA: D-glycero-D-manno-heptose 1-phosphate guanosyltransferase [Arcobacter sp.]|nr:D-glycero-D-manno-heptose 1-phosphate guanosyltransferase [Arcobacter sp.]
MEAIILAGGFGTRLQSVVKDVPKPMADINGRPFLEYILDLLANQGITDVILSVGYKKDIIKKHFKSKYKNINICYSVEELPLGTGGAIKKSLKMCKSPDVFVLNGDTYFNVNLNNLLKRYKELDCSLILSLKTMYNSDRYGSVMLKDNYISNFLEKTYKEKTLINGGVYIVKKNIFNNIELDNIFSFETDFLEKQIRNMNIGYLISTGYFIDIGVPEDYKKAQLDLCK